MTVFFSFPSFLNTHTLCLLAITYNSGFSFSSAVSLFLLTYTVTKIYYRFLNMIALNTWVFNFYFNSPWHDFGSYLANDVVGNYGLITHTHTRRLRLTCISSTCVKTRSGTCQGWKKYFFVRYTGLWSLFYFANWSTWIHNITKNNVHLPRHKLLLISINQRTHNNTTDDLLHVFILLSLLFRSTYLARGPMCVNTLLDREIVHYSV